jgi:hypothetical protein
LKTNPNLPITKRCGGFNSEASFSHCLQTCARKLSPGELSSVITSSPEHGYMPIADVLKKVMLFSLKEFSRVTTVSYTHLTLPTKA